MNDVKYQSKTIVIPQEAASGLQEFDVTLDTSHQRCTGVVMYENSNGGTNYQLGLADDDNTYHHMTNKRDWSAADSVPLNERYKNVAIPIKGTKLKIRVKTDAVTNSPLSIELVFRLEK